jgi:endonuclease G, mitochondrial
MGVFDEMLESAHRFRLWKKRQDDAATMKRSEKSVSTEQMAMDRLRYSGLKDLNVDPGVFLESIIEGNDLMPVRYFEMGRLASRPVGRIHFDLGPRIGQGYATGFLVAPGLLLTNHHVLPSPGVAGAATVTFDAEDDVKGLPLAPCVFRLAPKALYVADKELDFCFVGVSKTSSQGVPLSTYGHLLLHPGTGKILRNENATIVQHPRGRQKHVAVRNNEIIVYAYDGDLTASDAEENNHLYYSTDTLPGSSGAPVFSDQWYVVALHRRGVPATRKTKAGEAVLRKDNGIARPGDSDDAIRYVANEGVRISRIVRRLKELAGSNGTDRDSAEAAYGLIQSALSRPNAGPFWLPTGGASGNFRNQSVGGENGDSLEVARRGVEVFAGAKGFDTHFLGVEIGLPVLSAALEKAAARRTDKPESYVLPFRHFTTVMHAARRLPIFSAVNINGEEVNASAKPKRPRFSYDPRIDEAHQPDDSIFSSIVQRGHMTAREFVWWGDNDEALAADLHSFTLTNACPQIGGFNGSREWYQLERKIMKVAKDMQQRVNCFMGPIFSSKDPLYDDLRGDNSQAEWDTGIRMPLRFWYVIAWKDGGAIRSRAFILDQGDDIEEAGPLEFDFEQPSTVAEVTLDEVKKLTKLAFPGLD